MKISIIIPVYNEVNVLPMVLDRVMKAAIPVGCEKEIVIVDDGSTDGTSEVLDRYKDLVIIHHSVENFGKGAAIRIGIRKATGDVVLIQDGDLEYDPNDYMQVLQPIVDGTATVVYGSRFRGNLQGMKFANWLANKLLTTAANLLYQARITDEATAYKAFRMDVLRAMRLRCLRFEFCPEVTAKVRRLGHTIHEVPIRYNARGILEGKKIRWQDGFQAMWTLVKYRFVPMEKPALESAPSVAQGASPAA